MNLNQVTMPVVNMADSVAFYKALGFRLIVDAAPRYVRFECPSGDSTLSLHSVAEDHVVNGITIYLECNDLCAEVERLQGAGIVFDQLPVMQTWLWEEAHLHDPSGNKLILYSAGKNRKYPPWRID